MTLKQRVVITAIWTALIFVIGGVGIWYIGAHPISGVRTEARASKLGGGVGVLATLGYGCIWLPYAASIGKQRRAEREKAKRKRRR